jgi:hypothetical protein
MWEAEDGEEIMNGFMIGQRVIYSNTICTVCKPENNDSTRDDWIWIFNPERGYAHCAAEHNLKPLPSGQL